ncbi:MAG: cob(I)yrinic acid a,c-diamide adenosyltransferase [Bacteroidales bacterium OttesenSCG-928-I14]|jgi:cob(I)alamin adenosyltransferase|nr:cob(I)yrinic acid a,c-diamide adenosyltransferase [Bacteroidales bacterium OttesenSCG-928-I14]
MSNCHIYAYTGDNGYTSLIGGKRVIKTHPRIEAYGVIDELNSFIGYLLNEIDEKNDRSFLLQIQHILFALGSYLATENTKKEYLFLSENLIDLEKEIFKINELLPPLKCFILPGNCSSNALAHICRTICRRAERCIVCIGEQESIHPLFLKYTNRLSDYFFSLARKQSFINSTSEIIWNKYS